MNNKYREYAPGKSLSNVIDKFWEYGHNGNNSLNPSTNTILPDGCIDLIVDVSSLEMKIVGFMKIASLYNSTGREELIGIRFLPGGARRMLGDVSCLTDKVIDASLIDVFKKDFLLLPELLATCKSFVGRQEIVESIIKNVLVPEASRDKSTRWAIKQLTNNEMSLENIRYEIGISQRQFERTIKEYVGAPPKTFMKISRFQIAKKFLQKGVSAIEVAHFAGYSDQSHMIRDFKNISGSTPASYQPKTDGAAFVQSSL